ncbi:hypothetical protein F3Y22_tig00113124pilonHSYRG00059 [Hibiscus syriacus]|uniref:Reverse transcriptase domain-containing protein n=1 Tax=Hibiscus syriacus TaxID=106335 RepID=A0A6A2WQF2_HIBSY|nr:hypothetical protein F3Y22_tig00113124pilonHSYRG00059 [Hibiscus syriacus]
MKSHRIPKCWSISVNNVSKRIHSSSLKDVFQSYGEVIDVFIAYRNKKKEYQQDLHLLLLDLETRVERTQRCAGQMAGKTEVDRPINKVWRPSLRDSKSFREALGGVQGVLEGVQDERLIRSSPIVGALSSNIFIPKSELSCRERCLTGKIKNMYNGDIILTSLRAEGFDVKDVLLIVWSEKFFKDLGSRWGKVIKIDEETSNRTSAYKMRIQTEAHEGDRVFIDGSLAGGRAWLTASEEAEGAWHTYGEEATDVPVFEADFAKGCGFEKVHNDGVQLELLSQRCDNDSGTLHVSMVHANGNVGNSEALDIGLHEVPVVPYVGSGRQLVDESFGLMEINRNSDQVWAAQSISNSSRLLDVPVEEDYFLKDSDEGNGGLLNSSGVLEKSGVLRGVNLGSKSRIVKEAEAILAIGESLGVEFAAPRQEILQRLEQIEMSAMISWNETKLSEISASVGRRLKGLIGRELVYTSTEGASGGLISLLGLLFTWFTGGVNMTVNRLDRLLVSTDIAYAFPQLFQTILPRNDPILFQKIKGVCESNKGKGMTQILMLSKAETKAWVLTVRENKADFVEEIGIKIESLENLCILYPSNCLVQTELVTLKARLWAELRKQEREWLQKYRLKWFKEGDKTQDFHLIAATRGRTNQISKLKVQDSIIKHQKSIQQIFVNYFRSRLNDVKTMPVKRFGIPLKRIEDFSFNKSFIALIPKKVEATNLEDFRPISLMGCMYKIVARVLAKRMASCINEVIGENQYAFIAGKHISDCALIANEVIDYLFKSKKEAVLFKADFSKSYDTVDWKFLNVNLKKMGFERRWRKWINLCISTPLIVALVNGCPSPNFSIKRGLRQGCPLSPFLFNVVGEALSGLLKKAVEIDLCGGIRIGDGSVVVSHIQFADDLLIFLEAKGRMIKNIKQVLNIFEVVVGLKLNMKKIKIFSINVEENRVKRWADLISCSSTVLPTTYLGLPLGHKKNSKTLW